MTYRERINQLATGVDESFRPMFAIRVFDAYCRNTGIRFDTDDDFFKKNGVFMTFLASEFNEDIVREGLGKVNEFKANYKKGWELVLKGEELIREGYRLMEEGDYIAHHDTIGGYPRQHAVSLYGIHDKKGAQ